MAHDLRVLICDEDLDSRVTARKAVQRAKLDIAAETGYGTAAVSAALETKPDVVLLAVEESAWRPLETADALGNALPNTPIIVYSSVNDPEAVRRAMVHGGRDYVVQPMQAARLLEAVDAALQFEERRRMRSAGQMASEEGRGSVITVTGGKGGIGKTVTAVNLALALVTRLHKSAVLVDAAPHFGDAATMLDVTPQLTIKDLLTKLDRTTKGTIKEFLTRHSSGLAVLAAPQETDIWEGHGGRDLALILDLLAHNFDFVVVDSESWTEDVARAAMESSTISLLVTSGEVGSIRRTAAAVSRLEAWGIPPGRHRVLLSQGQRASGTKIKDIEEAQHQPVFAEVPYDEKVKESVQMGQPVVLLDPRSAAARSFEGLAATLAGTRRASKREVGLGLKTVRQLVGSKA